MRIVHVLRKPLGEASVAANVLRHGCGSLHIDACRLSTGENTRRQGGNTGRFSQQMYEGDRTRPTACGGHAGGWWPANLVLEHRDGCRHTGVERRRFSGGSPDYDSEYPDALTGTALEGSVDGSFNRKRSAGCQGSDGMETVEAWECEPGCPVAALDGQSGITTSTGGPTSGHNAFGQDSGWNRHRNRPTDIHREGDTGGASRFFKQVGGRR